MKINIEYDIGPNDLRALAKYLCRVSPLVQESQKLMRSLFPALALVSFAILAWLEQSLLLLSIGLLCAGFWFFLGPMIMKSKAIQQHMTVFSEDSFGTFGGGRKLAVDDDGITISSLDWSTHFEWSAIKRLFVDDQYAFLHHTEYNAIVIPLAQVSEKDFVSVTNAIQERTQRTNA